MENFIFCAVLVVSIVFEKTRIDKLFEHVEKPGLFF